MSKSAFRISGKPENDFTSVDPVKADASPMEVGLIDGRTMHVLCDPDGLTRATFFFTATGAILRAEERLYCVCPGIAGETYPGMTPVYSAEMKMDVAREDNATAVPSVIGLRRIVKAATARMDREERVRSIYDNHTKEEQIAALCAGATDDDLQVISDFIQQAIDARTAAVAAE